MKVYCSLPLYSSQPRLLKCLASRGIYTVFSLYQLKDVEQLTKLLDLSQVAPSAVVVRVGYSLFNSNASLANKLTSIGILNLIFTDWLGCELTAFPVGSNDNNLSIGFEILNSSEIHVLLESKVSFDFVLLKGHEAGGVVGSEHIHLLFHSASRILSTSNKAILLQGGLGIKGTAILSLMGANGVVLDNQLRLASDYPSPDDSFPRVIGAHETLTYQITDEYSLRLPRTFGNGIQQEVEANLATCYPLKSVKDEPLLVDQILERLGLNHYNVDSKCLGQEFGFAREYADKYKTLVDISLAYKREPRQAYQDLESFLTHKDPCDQHFAQDFGLAFDLLQGPMTRVSDTPEFIKAVSDGGALPFFAAAMIQPSVLRDKLQQTKELLGTQPWGVGLLGFLPRDIRTAQFEVIKDIKPPCVLIAGGRPDQIDEFASFGIQAFIHAPTLELFQQYISEGATNLILEGRECGGHVGPVGSLVLWEQCVEYLLNAKLPKPNQSYHIIFAGGIADPATCASARLLSYKAKESGIRIGILTGTPYLYTDEAVSTGAIIVSYRETVINASTTINLETGAGHASRCASTPFAKEFQVLKEKYISNGLTGYELREELEKLTLGRLRLATKGIKRDSSGLVSVSEEESYRDGMYMLGQSASLLGNKTQISELHERLTSKTFEFLSALRINQSQSNSIPLNNNGKVAIVAMDCMMPDSPDIHRFWEILISGQDVVKQTPTERWDPDLYYSPNKSDNDRTYSKWGGFLPPIDIDPIKLGIPPVSLKKIEPLQILTLELVTRLFENNSIDFSQEVRDRTSIFLGAGGGIGDMGGKYAARTEVERISTSNKSDIYSRLPEWGDETFPGLLFNVVAGRVANRLNLRGASYTVDAACASSLAAIYSAYRELTSGNCDLAIAGGVDTGQSPFAFLCFSRSQALSPTGRSKSFDQHADGIAISEGLGVVVMKRLDDALLDGDDVIAVIDGVGAASDGRGSSLTSPQTSGQQLAVERAWQSARLCPSTMSLYEAHGTGTVAGDQTELQTLLSITTKSHSKPQSCAVSSTKPNIGHTKSSAGIAGLMHAALCLHHRVLSPQIGATNPLPELQDSNSPIFLNKQPSFWPNTTSGRKAGVSAFGFGGTNYHIVLSEPPVQTRFKHSWPKSSSSLFTWYGSDDKKLRSQIADFLDFVTHNPSLSLDSFAIYHSRLSAPDSTLKQSPYRAALIAHSVDQLVSRLALILKSNFNSLSSVQKLDSATWLACLSLETPQIPVVLSFPGQGGLRENCLDDLIFSIDAVKDSLDQAVACEAISDDALRQLLLHRSSHDPNKQNFSSISMAELQPLICAIQLGLTDLLVNCGLQPDILIGHSLGELTATAVAGMWGSRSDFFGLMRYRGHVMDQACTSKPSGMVATSLTDRNSLNNILSNYTSCQISNINSPTQYTISGELDDLNRLVVELKDAGAKATLLNVSGGFHSPLMSQAGNEFKARLTQSDIRFPSINVLSMVDGEYYSSEAHESLARISCHMTESVDFIKGLSKLSSEPHLFINSGPSLTMEKLLKQNRPTSGDLFISLDDGSNEVDGCLNALANLFCLLPDFYPSLDYKLSPHDKSRSGTTSINSPAVVANGMAHMRNDVPHPSIAPPLTFATSHNPSPSDVRLSQNLVSKPQTTGLPSTDTPYQPLFGNTMTGLTSSTNQFMDPSASQTSVQIFSLYSENVRQMLASQERVALALIGQNPQVRSNISSSLTPQPINTFAPLNGTNGSSPNIQPAGISFDFLSSESEQANVTAESSAQISSTPEIRESHTPVPQEPPIAIDQQQAAASSGANELQAPSTPDMSGLLLGITSELTGYPLDMLDPSLALEADLGIDSIKRVEIFARLQKAVSSEIRESIIEKRDDLAEAPTLDSIISVLSGLVVSSGK